MISPAEFVSKHLEKFSTYLTGITSNTTTAGKYERLAVERFIQFKQKYQYKEWKLIRVLKFCSLLNIATTKDEQTAFLVQPRSDVAP